MLPAHTSSYVTAKIARNKSDMDMRYKKKQLIGRLKEADAWEFSARLTPEARVVGCFVLQGEGEVEIQLYEFSEATVRIATWRKDYNHSRPHSVLAPHLSRNCRTTKIW